MLFIVIFIVVMVFLFDLAKLRKQNEKMIEQNDRIIELLEAGEDVDDRNERTSYK